MWQILHYSGCLNVQNNAEGLGKIYFLVEPFLKQL